MLLAVRQGQNLLPPVPEEERAALPAMARGHRRKNGRSLVRGVRLRAALCQREGGPVRGHRLGGLGADAVHGRHGPAGLDGELRRSGLRETALRAGGDESGGKGTRGRSGSPLRL
uniref:(northern house mosquito) hypothetical protein n=1 Tax=Culex pipiens TaxID=7175 RepID=A0A8D8F1Q7_CULPI